MLGGAYSVLVDDVDDGRDLAGEGTLLDDGHATNLNEFLERLKFFKLTIALKIPTNYETRPIWTNIWNGRKAKGKLFIDAFQEIRKMSRTTFEDTHFLLN